jgi:hypothetical protein
MASKKHRHPEILRAFAEQVQHCEAGQCFDQHICCWAGWQYLEIHHVMGGPHRIDAAWNLVRLCKASHLWVTANPIEGRVLCWWILHQRGAFDCKAIHAATGIHPAGWIGSKQSDIRLQWVADLVGVLLEVSE